MGLCSYEKLLLLLKLKNFQTLFSKIFIENQVSDPELFIHVFFVFEKNMVHLPFLQHFVLLH